MNKKAALFVILFLMPIAAFASGDAILTTLYIQVISIIAFIVIIALIRSHYSQKFLMCAVYFITIVLIWWAFGNIPYMENKDEMNLLLTILPIATTLFTYVVRRLIFKKLKVNDI